MDFSKIDLSQDSWYSFLNIIEDKPELCISGNDKNRHKVKHFTYLYGLNTREIIKIGTSYYKHHSIKNHIKNEILLTILREIVEYKWADTVVINLEDKIRGGIFRFIDNKIEGYVVINENRKFKTDFSPDEELNTYYIQEIFINPQHRNKKLGKVLFEYTIQRSSNVIISLMTTPNNISMISIAEYYGFIAQSISSGDDLHSLLMIYKK
jgi:GNAT superfamily N-acetyltransferase